MLKSFLFGVTYVNSTNQDGQYDISTIKDSDLGGDGSAMESVLSLDDGRWLRPSESPQFTAEERDDNFPLGNIRQPSPPPVLAQIQQDCHPIPPSKVADPRPGPATSQHGISSSNSYQHLHIVSWSNPWKIVSPFVLAYGHSNILLNACFNAFDASFFLLALQPVSMMEDFLRLAMENTKKNLETCGVLAGSLVRATDLFYYKRFIWIVKVHVSGFLSIFLLAVEKQGFPYHDAYNPEAGVNFRFCKMTVFFNLVYAVLCLFFFSCFVFVSLCSSVLSSLFFNLSRIPVLLFSL